MSAIDSEAIDNDFPYNIESAKASPIKIGLQHKHEKNTTSGLMSPQNKDSNHRGNIINYQRRLSLDPENSRKNSRNAFNYRHTNTWDLDDENSNIIGNRAQWATNSSLSSCGVSSYQPRIGAQITLISYIIHIALRIHHHDHITIQLLLDHQEEILIFHQFMDSIIKRPMQSNHLFLKN